MKKWTWFCIASISLLLTACGSNHSPVAQSDSSSTVSVSLTPTGYPSDEVQRPCAYYNGRLYLYSGGGFDQPLEVGFEKAGTVTAVDNTEFPSEEFRGSRLDIGQEIYSDKSVSDKIYVKYDSGFGLFEAETEAGTVSKNIIPHINDGSADWSGVETVYLYGAGCAAPPTHTIRDRGTVSLLVEQIKNSGEYEKIGENDILVKNSGSGAIPTVITFRREENGTYALEEYKTALDGSLYAPSIKEMFPEELWKICILPSDDDVKELTKQEREYAVAY